MVDAIYNVLRRPIANEPEKKDMYHVDRPHKDAEAKPVDDDDAKEGKRQKQMVESYTNIEDDKTHHEELPDEPIKGKGKYVDDEGNEHLDIFV